MVDLHHFSSGAQSVLAYATVNGALVGWDLRSSSNAWTLRHDLKAGLITSFAVDIHQCWLCIGRELPFRSLPGSGCCCRACLLRKLFSFVFIANFPLCSFFPPYNYYNTYISIFSLKNKFERVRSIFSACNNLLCLFVFKRAPTVVRFAGVFLLCQGSNRLGLQDEDI